MKSSQLLPSYSLSSRLPLLALRTVSPSVSSYGHQSSFNLPLSTSEQKKPCLLFLVISQETDQPFQFGTAAYDYLQETDFLTNCNVPRFLADVVQLTNNIMTPYPTTVRIEEGKQFVHLSEFATIYCPFCAICFLSTLGARPCFIHTAGIATSISHLVGGLDGTGGLSLIGPITATAQTATPEWIVIHVVDNERVQELIDTNVVSAFRSVLPLLWSPAWYAHHNLSRPESRHIGKSLLHMNAIDGSGEYLIFLGTEEWSRLLISFGEAPPE